MRKSIKLGLAMAAVATATLASVGTAAAGPTFTSFGSATGIQQANYGTPGGAVVSLMNRSGSGIVEQWLAPGTLYAGTYGSYYLFKPLSNGTNVTTPFKQSCDSQGLTGTPQVWTYLPSNYTPTTALTSFFPYNGLTYWLCQYDLYNHAEGDLTFTAASIANRHVVFAVHGPSLYGPAGGTYTYTDADGTYTINFTSVTFTPTTVAFTGTVVNPSAAFSYADGWYFSGLYTHVPGGTDTWAGTWGPAPLPDAGANYPVDTGGATIYVR